MSLTDVVADSSSALAVFIDDRFPAISDLAHEIGTQVADCAVPAVRERGRIVPWRTVGTAIDHRLRLAFTPDAVPKPPGEQCLSPESTNAISAGVYYALAVSSGGDHHPLYAKIASLGLELISRFQELTREIAPCDPTIRIDLGGRIERELCTLCYAGAWYDGLHRTGDIEDERHQELRYAASTSGDLDDMLTAISEIAVTNMVNLVHHAELSDITALRERVPGGRTCVSGPTFSGSRDVDGADADLVVDHLLLEIKTHANPAATARDTLRQLVGYLLLDYGDSYKLARAGVYYVRQARLIQWRIPDLLQALGCFRGIAELRQECVSILRG